jgi:uncharacterized protein YfaS (alpha-2-macroglobulin family)
VRTSTRFLNLALIALLFLTVVSCRRAEPVDITPPATVETAPTGEGVTEQPTEATPTEAAAPTAASPAVMQPLSPEDFDWPPQVVASSPAPGEDTALDTIVLVRFDQPMDQASVEQAFAIEPAVPGAFSWPEPDTLAFTPNEPLSRNTDYSIRVADSASAVSGESLEQTVEIDWQTVGDLTVTQFQPEDGTQDVQTDAIVTVVFNQPVVPLVTTGDQADLPQPLIFDPPIDGRGEWTSTSIYRFLPDPAFAAGTTYTVSVDPALTALSGSVVAEAPSWQFTTGNPDVVTFEPQVEEGRKIVPTTPITITFNMPMDRAATEAAINFEPAAPVTYSWSDEDRVVTVEPDGLLTLGTDYTVTVSTGATAAAGATTLEEPFTRTLTTVPLPSVVSTVPADGQVADQWQSGFSVVFASPMDTDTILNQLIIEPDPGDVDYFINEWESTYEVYVNFTLVPQTTYVVTIPGSAADPYGNTLAEDYTFSFTAPPFSSLASFNLPREVAQLSTSFPTAVGVQHRNVSEFTVSLYDMGLDIDMLINTYRQNENPPTGDPIFQQTFTSTTGEDLLGYETVQLADGGTLPTGLYRLVLTAPEVEEDSRWWQIQNVILIVADTNLVVKEMFGAVHVWATDLGSGDPAEGRALTLYTRQGAEAGTSVTDANGFATFDYEPAENYLDGVAVISNAPGEPGFGAASSIWNATATPWNMGINTDTGAEQALYAYIYTDRPIYRPGDTLYFKGIVRDPNFGRFALPEVTELELNINPAFYYGEATFSTVIPVTVDEEGIFTGEFQIPADMQLGTWSFTLTGDFWQSSRNFTVAEYRRPEFLVSVTPSPAETVRGDAAAVEVNAAYLFGAPAGGLPVNWTVYEQEYFPTIKTTPPYIFGDQAGFFYTDNGPFSGFGGGEYGRYVTDGNGETDAAGNLTIPLAADLLTDAGPGSREVQVEATIGGLGEFPVTGRTTIVYHAADAYVGLATDNSVVDAGEEVAVDLITVDWEGTPVAGYPVEVTLYQRDWEQDRNTQFGMYYTQWTPVDTAVSSESVTTDAQGEANVTFTTEGGGTYLVVATLTDPAGREQTSSLSLWTVDPAYAGWRTDPNQRTMDLVANQDSYVPGDTAEILVQSPFAQPVNAWLVIERGELLEQRVVTIDGSTVLQIPITPLFAPNVQISVVAIKPVNTADPDFPYADIRIGIIDLPVSIEQLTLNVELSAGQDVYEPGDTATFTVAVTDFQGNPVPAEVSLALVDLAVLTLKEDNAPPITEAFYSPQPLRSQTGSGLFITGEGLEPEEPLQGGGLGGGGGADEALASVRVEGEEDGVREDFKDTAYWEARLQLDGSGQATVEVPLPDNVTTWRMSSKATTPETLVGQSSVDIQTRLPLIVRPITPRFFTAGDVVNLGANVNNNTDQAIEATVSLAGAGVTLLGDADQTVSVPANGRATVRWPVTVNDVPFVDLTFRVEGGSYSDASKPTVGNNPDNLVPVYRYSGRDFVATAGELDEAGRRVEAILLPEGVNTAEGQVVARLQPSLAAAITESFEVFNADIAWYNAQCPSMLADRLLNNTATERALRELALDNQALAESLASLNTADVTALENQVQGDGGWTWCGSSSPTDGWITAQVLLALTKAQELGYTVNDVVINDATLYLDRELESVDALRNASEVNRQAFYLYVMAEAGSNVSGDADALVDEHRDLLDPYAKALLALAYELSGDAGDNQAALLTDLNNSVIMSATGAHWEDAEQDVSNLSTDIRGTAMVISALSQLAPDSPLLPPAVRWVMVARTAENWPTVHQTAWSVTGLTDWMIASGELDANYDYQLAVNLQSRAGGSFSADTITESEVVSVPVADLFTEDTNFFDFRRGDGDGRLYYTLALDAAIAVDSIDPVSRGMTVERQYFDAACDPATEICEPLTEIAANQRVRVQLTVIVPNDRTYVVVEDPIPAGAEALDPNLLTSASGTAGSIVPQDREDVFGFWGWWYFDTIQYGDDQVTFLSQYLPAGTYQYTYFLDAVVPGTYQVRPATAREQYFPEVFGRSDGLIFTITE